MYKNKIIFTDGDPMFVGSYDSFDEANETGPYWCRKAYVDLIYPQEGYPTCEVVEFEDE